MSISRWESCGTYTQWSITQPLKRIHLNQFWWDGWNWSRFTEWSKPERKTPIQYTNTYIWNFERWQWRPCMQDNKKDTDVYNGLLDSEGERVGWFGRMALKHVYYHVRNESPVYVWCRIQHAWGWCMGMTQRDVMGREVRGGFMFGNACTPVVDSCQCMAKPIQYCKEK